MSRIVGTLLILLVVAMRPFAAPTLTLPNRADTLKFAVLGDSGSGDAGQYGLADADGGGAPVVRLRVRHHGRRQLLRIADAGGARRESSTRPYKPLLDAGVTFHAAIGNHDEPFTVNYPPLNMGGRRYYTYVRQQVRFFVLDTNIMDGPQLRWFESELQQSRSRGRSPIFIIRSMATRAATARRWTSACCSSRCSSSTVSLSSSPGTITSTNGLKPQKGVHYFVTGSGGKLRTGDLVRSETTAAGFDRDQAFVIAEVDGDALFFQTISRTGATVDSGMIPRPLRHDGTR